MLLNHRISQIEAKIPPENTPEVNGVGIRLLRFGSNKITETFSLSRNFSQNIYSAAITNYPNSAFIFFGIYAIDVLIGVTAPYHQQYELAILLNTTPNAVVPTVAYTAIQEWRQRVRRGFIAEQLMCDMNQDSIATLTPDQSQHLDLEFLNDGNREILLPIFSQDLPQNISAISLRTLESLAGNPKRIAILRANLNSRTLYTSALIHEILKNPEAATQLMSLANKVAIARPSHAQVLTVQLLKMRQQIQLTVSMGAVNPGFNFLKWWKTFRELRSLTNTINDLQWRLAQAKLRNDLEPKIKGFQTEAIALQNAIDQFSSKLLLRPIALSDQKPAGYSHRQNHKPEGHEKQLGI